MPTPVLNAKPIFGFEATAFGTLRMVQLSGPAVPLPGIYISHDTPRAYREAFANQFANAYYFGTDSSKQLIDYYSEDIDFRITVLNNKNYIKYRQDAPGYSIGAHVDKRSFTVNDDREVGIERNLFGPDFVIYIEGESLDANGPSFSSVVGFILSHETVNPRLHQSDHNRLIRMGTSVTWQDIIRDSAEGAGIDFLYRTGQSVNVDGFQVSPQGKSYADFAREVA